MYWSRTTGQRAEKLDEGRVHVGIEATSEQRQKDHVGLAIEYILLFGF